MKPAKEIDDMLKYINIALNILIALVIILFITTCIWTYELHREPQTLTVSQAFKNIEDYDWTPEELKRIKERQAFLEQCEKNIIKADRVLALYSKHIKNQKNFIEEYGE